MIEKNVCEFWAEGRISILDTLTLAEGQESICKNNIEQRGNYNFFEIEF